MTDYRTLWDWRRTVAALYADIRDGDDPQAAHRIWRERRRALFAAHDQSPIEPDARPTFRGPHVYNYDAGLRIPVRLDPLDAERVEMDAGHDGTLRLAPFARTDGLAPVLGRELILYWIETYGGGVLLPFRDLSNGVETYGGGRYLLDTVKSADLGSDAEGRVILDFNFAYYPSCAYSDRYVCPLAPRDNRVDVAIRAGERNRSD